MLKELSHFLKRSQLQIYWLIRLNARNNYLVPEFWVFHWQIFVVQVQDNSIEKSVHQSLIHFSLYFLFVFITFLLLFFIVFFLIVFIFEFRFSLASFNRFFINDFSYWFVLLKKIEIHHIILYLLLSTWLLYFLIIFIVLVCFNLQSNNFSLFLLASFLIQKVVQIT
jgi:hypothetical protein